MHRTLRVYALGLFACVSLAACIEVGGHRRDHRDHRPGIDVSTSGGTGASASASTAAGASADASAVREPRRSLQSWSDRVVIKGDPVRVRRGEVLPGSLIVVDGQAQVDGEVRGDLVVVAGSLRVGPTARIGGDLVAVGNTVTEISPGARVANDRVVVNYAGIRWIVQNALYVIDHPEVAILVGGTTLLVVLVLGFLWIVRPYDGARFHATVVERPVRSGLTGLLVLVGLHVLMVLAFASRYAIGMIPVLGLLVLGLSVVGWLMAAAHLGQHLAATYGWKLGRMGAGLAGIGIGCLAFLVPVLGQVAAAGASWVGVGALLFPARDAPQGAAPAATPEPRPETPPAA